MKKKCLTLLAAVLALAMLLAGCGSGNTGGTQDGASSTGATNADGERVLRIRKTASLISTDWELVTDTADLPIIWVQVFQGLYGINEAEGGYYKELAKEVDISDDGLVYTITLQDATFQNGDPLKASDVVFSYNRAMQNARFNYVTNMIDKVEEVDEKTVRFTLKYPYSAIDHTFFTIKISSEREVTEAGDSFGTGPHTAGTGPYYISEYDPASGLTLKAYDGYWEGEPAIKEVQYIIISEDSAAVIAFENGEIDFMTDAPTAEWDALVSASGENNAVLKGNNIRMLCINYQSDVNNGILGNPLVRQAICYAVDKESINAVAAGGLGTPTAEYMPSDYVPTAPAAAEGGYETFEYNPEKARELLLEAGFTEADLEAGISVGTLTTYGAATGEKAKAAQVIQSNLKDVGLICEVEVADASIITPRLKAQDYDLGIYGDSGNFDFNNIRQQVHSESEGTQVIKYRDENSCVDWERVEELCDLGVGTTDVEQRKQYYTELWSIIAESATIFPYLHMPVCVVWSDDLNIDKAQLCPTYYHLYDFSWQ